MLQKGSLYEYSLYASIILLSGMGVASLPSYLDETPVSPVNAYTASMYLSFLVWAFRQLHELHGQKSEKRTQARPSLVKDAHTAQRVAPAENSSGSWMSGLNLPQRLTVQFLLALGSKISRIEAPADNQPSLIHTDAKEKPEAA